MAKSNRIGTKKGADELRFCVAICALNEATITDHYPLPRSDDLLDKLAGYQWYTTVNGYSRYYYVEMEVNSKSLPVFRTPCGVYQWKVMLFGLKNARSVYNRLVEEVYGGLERIGVL